MTVPDSAGAGGGEQRLTQAGAQGAFSPSWSPDGTQIVCVVDVDPDPQSWDLTLHVLNVHDALQSGGAAIAAMRALPRVGASVNDWPAWSPTASRIALSAVVAGHRDIYVVNADGTDLQQITHTPESDEFAPAWSPDGTQIVFQANPDAQWDIYVMNADGSDRRRLTTDVANDTAPSWAP
jgi:TolB protein